MQDGQFPFQVSIVSRSPRTGRMFICSGAIINSGWVLTSATCVSQSTQYEVRFNSVNFYTGGVVTTSRVGHVHPQYDSVSQLNNLGLIQAYTYSAAAINLLPTEMGSQLYLRKAFVVGWGLLHNDISPVLQLAWGRTLEPEDPICKHNFNNVAVNTNRLCATFSGQPGCAGDTGSPLIIDVNHTIWLIGVSSFDAQYKGCEKSTSLFSGLTSDAREWIREMAGVSA